MCIAFRCTWRAIGRWRTTSRPRRFFGFERVRRYNRSRDQLLAFAMAFALMPFAFVFQNGHITWLMVRDNPTQAIYFLVAAAGCGIAYYWVGRRVRAR